MSPTHVLKMCQRCSNPCSGTRAAWGGKIIPTKTKPKTNVRSRLSL